MHFNIFNLLYQKPKGEKIILSYYVSIENDSLSICWKCQVGIYGYSFLNYNKISKIDWGEIVNLKDKVNYQWRKNLNIKHF